MYSKPNSSNDPCFDEDGFPLLKPDSDKSPKTSVTCPICFDASGGAYVCATKRGLPTIYCHACQTRIFSNSDTSHELLRRLVKLLKLNPELRTVLTTGLAQID